MIVVGIMFHKHGNEELYLHDGKVIKFNKELQVFDILLNDSSDLNLIKESLDSREQERIISRVQYALNTSIEPCILLFLDKLNKNETRRQCIFMDSILGIAELYVYKNCMREEDVEIVGKPTSPYQAKVPIGLMWSNITKDNLPTLNDSSLILTHTEKYIF